MVFNPLRIYRRHRRLEREATEEAQLLRRRFGEAAIHAAREKLTRGDLTWWGRRVIKQAIKLLRRRL